MTFSDFDFAKPIVRAIASEGYDTPTPIQAQCLPAAQRGCAQIDVLASLGY